MKKRTSTLCEHAELLLLPDGRILAHNITPEIAAILAELDPKDELIARRVVKTSSLKQQNETPAGN